MAFWIPETAVATVTAATTMPTINQSRALDGRPNILEIPPEIFMNACATEPAIPAPMANKVIAFDGLHPARMVAAVAQKEGELHWRWNTAFFAL